MAKRWAKNKVKIIGNVIGGLMLAGIVGSGLWFSFPAQATSAELHDAKAALTLSYTEKSGAIVLNPVIPATSGLIFYPDAHVSPAAYAHRLSAVAKRGVAVIIVKPILNNPLWDWQSVTDLTSNVSSIKNWYVAGHAAGGVKACQVASNNEQLKGLILMATSCANNISGRALPVLSLIGADDAISSQQTIEKDSALLPAKAKSQVIDGLTHAGFGNYGTQNGDGMLQLDDLTIQQKLADLVSEFVGIPSQ